MDAITSGTRLGRTELMSGLEAIVRGILEHAESDRRHGFKTAGFVSGYRGSPLGTLDMELWSAKSRLEKYDIRFQPGLNEDLAATACWGTQQVPLMPNPRFEGVYSFWYGKGPGVDRSGDAIKHGNLAGTSPRGGVVLFAGDDHGAKSSSTAHQSDHAFVAASIPVFNPASIEEYVEHIPVAVALSRFASVWVGFKCITETVESSATFSVAGQARDLAVPSPFAPEGVHISLAFNPPKLEESLQLYRIPAVKRFAKANQLDKVAWNAPSRTLGIVASGKAYVDLLEALRLLGIDKAQAAAKGIRIFKPLVTWPIEPEGIAEFCRGHREVMVIEEKRPVVEWQLAQILVNMPQAARPMLSGKACADGSPLLPDFGELSPSGVAVAIGRRILALGLADERLQHRIVEIDAHEAALRSRTAGPMARAPMFCSGCPHSRSTRMPEGSIAFGGIGCHGMAMWVPELHTMPSTHMGAEGANWIGIEPYGGPEHIFQNMGDGTYAHSGLLAIRAAIAANSNITYKVLYNAAVAMTGGQPVEGGPDALAIARQIAAEGAKRVALVTEDLTRYPNMSAEIGLYHRDRMDEVQREMRAVKGVTAIVYDQGCAAERRRLRKQGQYPDPAVRTFINSDVCEGCGDCNEKSSCVSVLPVETEFGTKRTIDQDSCNKDYTCATGFCPSFVTIKGGELRRTGVDDSLLSKLADDLVDPPGIGDIDNTHNVLIAGIGGTGIITLGSMLAQAAALEGRPVLTFDVTGVSQKNGAVFSHVRFLESDATGEFRPRIPREQLDVLIGGDAIAATAAEIVPLVSRDRTSVFVNTEVVPTAMFQRHPDEHFGFARFAAIFEKILDGSRIHPVTIVEGARKRLGSGAPLNVFLLGFAYQKGSIPLQGKSIEQALSAGSGGKKNILAFRLGRLCAQDRGRLAKIFQTRCDSEPLAQREFPDLVARCKTLLTEYQGKAYADLYEDFVLQTRRMDPAEQLSRAVALNLFKLMRYKDEYEVARLHESKAFWTRLGEEFQGDFRVNFNLAPPILSSFGAKGREPRKYRFGPGIRPVFRILARLKFLRGTPFDPFGYQKDRRLERQLIAEYRFWILRMAGKIHDGNYAIAMETACVPAEIKGYGAIKERSAAAARIRVQDLWTRFESLP